jgi:large subunit ribosomal protein L29|tara:strand:+ start:454 stop:675 length:222 start_codon:yes stop_codon:yes gene_type:complete
MKSAEINKLNIEDILTKIDELVKKLKDLKMNHKVSPIENPIQIKFLRRDIARLKTEIINRDMKINTTQSEPKQ